MGEKVDPKEYVLIQWQKPNSIIVLLVACTAFLSGFATNSLLTDYAPAALPDITQTASAAVLETPEDQGNSIIAVDHDDDPFLGPADAPITIVEFSDYQCPFCKRFRDQTLDQLMSTYEGQIRFVYRDFPLSNIHPNAQNAAEAAECADDQGAFWAMHDLLFAKQSSWANSNNVMDELKNYAISLGLSSEVFENCLDGGVYADEVEKDYEDGVSYGISGTPTFFVNGRMLVGAVPLKIFQTVIDDELAAIEQ